MNPLTRKTIAKRCIDLNITLASIAKDAGVTKEAIYNVTMERNLSHHLRVLICRRLKLRLADLGWDTRANKHGTKTVNPKAKSVA